jgi:hypothetical protein
MAGFRYTSRAAANTNDNNKRVVIKSPGRASSRYCHDEGCCWSQRLPINSFGTGARRGFGRRGVDARSEFIHCTCRQERRDGVHGLFSLVTAAHQALACRRHVSDHRILLDIREQ